MRPGCPVSLVDGPGFIDGLLHDLGIAALVAGIQMLQMRLSKSVIAFDTCIMAFGPEQTQALIDEVVSYCAILQMEISVPKTRVIILSAVPRQLTSTCCSSPVEQVTTCKYLGALFQ